MRQESDGTSSRARTRPGEQPQSQEEKKDFEEALRNKF